ncbi:hypothetical protein ES703_47793 [subsurface metagenome]
MFNVKQVKRFTEFIGNTCTGELILQINFIEQDSSPKSLSYSFFPKTIIDYRQQDDSSMRRFVPIEQWDTFTNYVNQRIQDAKLLTWQDVEKYRFGDIPLS